MKKRKQQSMNGHTSVEEHLRHDTLDALWGTMEHFVTEMETSPGLFKVDVDAAFRRLLLRPEHTWASGVVFKHNGQVWLS